MTILRGCLLSAVLAVSLLAQSGETTSVEIFVEGLWPTLRPNESIALQVRAYTERTNAAGVATKERARVRQANIRVVDNKGGWVSRPFAYQGKDDAAYYGNSAQGRGRDLLGSMLGDYVYQDTVLYTAPPEPGKYAVEATFGSQKASITINVDTAAPSNVAPEETTFPPYEHTDTYLSLAAHWSPMIAQEIWYQPKSDMLHRFDYDGDFHGDNNWDNLDKGSSQAYVHYAVSETETHWFLIYNFFHPRDYSDRCIAGSCHEDDNEGIILTVRKDGTEFGKLEVMETLAHDNIYSYTNESGIRNGVHDIDGRIEFYKDTHPIVFVESGGHGIFGSTDKKSRYNVQSDTFFFDSSTAAATPWISLGARASDSTSLTSGITYIYKGTAERPSGAAARLAGYDLLPIYDEWFVRAIDDEFRGERMFDDFQTYAPLGDRPGMLASKEMGTAFYGRKEATNKAKPFWGWHDVRTKKGKVLGDGQWGLDPAYAVSRDVTFPAGQPFSLNYIYNPYLGIFSWQAFDTK
jgi:hypothetical protein